LYEFNGKKRIKITLILSATARKDIQERIAPKSAQLIDTKINAWLFAHKILLQSL